MEVIKNKLVLYIIACAVIISGCNSVTNDKEQDFEYIMGFDETYYMILGINEYKGMPIVSYDTSFNMSFHKEKRSNYYNVEVTTIKKEKNINEVPEQISEIKNNMFFPGMMIGDFLRNIDSISFKVQVIDNIVNEIELDDFYKNRDNWGRFYDEGIFRNIIQLIWFDNINVENYKLPYLNSSKNEVINEKFIFEYLDNEILPHYKTYILVEDEKEFKKFADQDTYIMIEGENNPNGNRVVNLTWSIESKGYGRILNDEDVTIGENLSLYLFEKYKK